MLNDASVVRAYGARPPSRDAVVDWIIEACASLVPYAHAEMVTQTIETRVTAAVVRECRRES